MKETKLFELVTGTEMKPWLSRNMLPNINTCENGWSNFSANLKVVLLELTQFPSPNLSIYCNCSCAVPRDDVIKSPRFLMRPPVNHSTMGNSTKLELKGNWTKLQLKGNATKLELKGNWTKLELKGNWTKKMK